MINWVIGGIVFGLTIFIVIRTILKMRKGQGCCCEDCNQSQCSSRSRK